MFSYWFLIYLFYSKAHPLPNLTVEVKDVSAKGYYFFSPVKIGPKGASLPIIILLDGQGQVVYYKKFDHGPYAGSFRLQSNGTASYYFDQKFYFLKDDFKLVDSVYCANGVETNPRDLLVLPNGNYLLMGTKTTEMDLSRYKWFKKNSSPGSKKAQVKYDIIQELDKNKKLVVEWNAKDHYAFSDVDASYLFDPAKVDWMHANAVEYDYDGNYLLSVRNFNEITKINRNTGQIMWRLGGKKNQFTIPGDSCGFSGQHDIRRLPDGTITLFNNGKAGPPFCAESAKQYRINEATKTARLVWTHVNNPKSWSPGYGNVQRLSNGNTLINYGRSTITNIIFNVLTPTGEKIFELSSPDSLTNYRAYYYETLPFKINRPKISCFKKNNKLYLDAGTDYPSYRWNTGSTARSIEVKHPGSYSVFVPSGNGGFISSETLVIKNIGDCPTGK